MYLYGNMPTWESVTMGIGSHGKWAPRVRVRATMEKFQFGENTSMGTHTHGNEPANIIFCLIWSAARHNIYEIFENFLKHCVQKCLFK